MIPALPTARVGKRILLYTCLARKACSPSASAPQPTSARPVLARSLEVASIRAAANPPAVPLPVSDKGGHRGEACTWGPKCGPRGRSHVGRHLPISAAPCPPTCPAPRLSALEGAAESPGTGAPVTREHGAAHPCAAGHRARQRSRRTANAKDHARAHGSVDLASVLEPGSARAKMKPSAPPLLSQDWSLQLGASRGQPRDGVHLTRRGPNLRLSHREVQVLNTEHPYRSTRLQRSSNTLYALGAEARRPRQDVPGRP